MAKENFEILLDLVVKEGASDLHIAVNRYPTLRIDGSLTPLLKQEPLTPDTARDFVFNLLNEEQKAVFLKEKELDLSYNFQNRARFRVNVFHQRGSVGAAMRLIPSKIKSFQELGLPPLLQELAKSQQGFFLVVGPTGHGKSTTLAAFIDYINHNRSDHIMTIEDPMEYLFVSDKATIDQREVGNDTASFQRALKSMLREDVDVVMVGEMRDAETMAMAVTAAETGHLVLSTLHTNDASQTIDRIIDTFPPNQQNQIRAQLAASIIGIISQRLIPKNEGGRVPAIELMIANPAVRNLIRENKVHQLNLVIETSFDQGMVSLNRSLIDLVRKGDITMANAVNYSLSPAELQTLLRG